MACFCVAASGVRGRLAGGCAFRNLLRKLLGAARWRRRGVNMDLWDCPGRWTEPRQLVGSRRCPERSSSLLASVLRAASSRFASVLFSSPCFASKCSFGGSEHRFSPNFERLAASAAFKDRETAETLPHVLPPRSQLSQAIRFRKARSCKRLQRCDHCSSVAPPRASRPRCSLHSSRRYNKNQRLRYRRRR